MSKVCICTIRPQNPPINGITHAGYTRALNGMIAFGSSIAQVKAVVMKNVSPDVKIVFQVLP